MLVAQELVWYGFHFTLIISDSKSIKAAFSEVYQLSMRQDHPITVNLCLLATYFDLIRRKESAHNELLNKTKVSWTCSTHQ
ncbi:MAG: hypothetical protein CMQ45_05420 [Gammaproteobacteria bacterium]|nr:hypothetical protein [Gammaproteobacteria bacterium]